MRKLLLAPLLALASLGVLSAGTVSAQIVSPYSQPGFRPGYNGPLLSPYLNLLRGGDTASNYFLGTVPEIQRRQNAQLYGTAINNLESRENSIESQLQGEDQALTKQKLVSGHGTARNTTLGYFGNTGGYYPGVPRVQTVRPNPAIQQRSRLMGSGSGSMMGPGR